MYQQTKKREKKLGGKIKMIYITSTVSPNMLLDRNCTLNLTPLSKEEFKQYAVNAESRIGTHELADVLSDELELYIEYNRRQIKLDYGDFALVATIDGKSIRPGESRLPIGSKLIYTSYEVVKKESLNLNLNVKNTEIIEEA